MEVGVPAAVALVLIEVVGPATWGCTCMIGACADVGVLVVPLIPAF